MAGERISYRIGRSGFRDFETGNKREWLLSNGIGGYANSTVHGNSSRIFSSYLIASLHPPVDRVLVLAKTHEEFIFYRDQEDSETARKELLAPERFVSAEASTEGVKVVRRDLATQQYPGYLREGYRYQTSFTFDFWPEYHYFFDGIKMSKRIALTYGKNETVISYTLENHSGREAVFSVTPLFNFRPFGEVSEKSSLNFSVQCSEREILLTPRAAKEYQIRFVASEGEFYDRRERKTSMATPNYLIEENQLYSVDMQNGFTGVDHHFTPYELHIELKPGEKKEIGLICELLGGEGSENPQYTQEDSLAYVQQVFREAASRAEGLLERAGSSDALTGRLALSADHFLVRRASTGYMTILAGYPWFADWGRDTMIAFTGLTLATGRFEEAREVLLSFAKYVSRGMIPNVFPNHAKDEPMYNTIDASLWYFYAVYKYLQYTTGLPCYRAEEKSLDGRFADKLSEEEIFIRDKIYPVLCEIFESYQKGKARYGIHMEEDGLIAGGGGLDQLTWMDVRVGDIVVTPRHGKAVEINALWYNAICCMRLFRDRFFAGESENAAEIKELDTLSKRVCQSFVEKFWNPALGCLYDTVGEEGKDASIRPNQIFAVSLPFSMLPAEKEKSIVRVVYENLYTPYGLRSLAPGESGYHRKYSGRLIERDLAYHMGTTWGYLAGAFFDAWAKTMGQEKDQLNQMIENFADHMTDGCLGGIAEIFDGDFACESRGCYTQAWSVAEVLRARRELLKK